MEPEIDIHAYSKPKIKATQRQGNPKQKRQNSTTGKTESSEVHSPSKPSEANASADPPKSKKSHQCKPQPDTSQQRSSPQPLAPLSLKQVYHPRQSPNGDCCRLHALNAFFGFEKLSLIAFNKYSDEFDRLHKLHVGTTKTYFILPEANDGGDEPNIFSFIIAKLTKNRFETKYFSMGSKHIGDFVEELGDCLEGFIEFTEGHVWYTKKSGSSYFIIDCIAKKVKQARNNPLDVGLGHVLIWKSENFPATLKQTSTMKCNLDDAVSIKIS